MSPLRVGLLTQYWPPEVGAPQARWFETARAWSRLGLRVTVLTGFPNHPTGVIPPRWRGLVGSTTEFDVAPSAQGGGTPLRVLRSWLLAARNRGAFRRTLAHATCAATSTVRGFAGAGHADVFVATSPPLFTGLAGLALARIHRRPFVLDLRDLWPDAFVDLGLAREGRVVDAFRRIEGSLYREADHVVAVTESFADRVVRAGVPGERVTVIRNGVDLARFPAPDLRDATRARLGLERFTVLYLGAHGVAQGLERLLPAAKATESLATWLFVGEGAEKEALVAAARRERLANVRFEASVSRDEVPAIYAAADAVLVSLRPTPLMEAFLPSKAYEAMGAGKPVVAAVAGEAARLLGAGGAVVVPPGDVAALSDAVALLAAAPERAEALGREGRARAEREFDRDALARRYAEVLASTCARRGKRS